MMAVGSKVRHAACALLALASGSGALQMTKDAFSEEWNPLDIFRSNPFEIFRSGTDTEEVPSAAGEMVSHVSEAAKAMGKKATLDEKAVIEDLKPWVRAEGNRTRPRMLVTPGCDGSSAVMQHAHSIMELYGINTNGQKLHTLHDNISHVLAPTGQRVLVEDQEHLDIACNDKCRAIVQAQQYYEAKNRSLLFKGTVGEDQPAITSKSIFDMGTFVAEVTRKNTLDQIVCMVRDCFANQEFGHPLLNGEKSDLCWKRRESTTGKYQAFVKPSALLENMDRLDSKMQKTTKELEAMGYPVEEFWAEDLLDFEWNKDAVGKSVQAWTNLLKAWGIRPGDADVAKLKAYLEENVGLKEAPANHVDTVFNFEDVKKILQGKNRYSWMIREGSQAGTPNRPQSLKQNKSDIASFDEMTDEVASMERGHRGRHGHHGRGRHGHHGRHGAQSQRRAKLVAHPKKLNQELSGAQKWEAWWSKHVNKSAQPLNDPSQKISGGQRWESWWSKHINQSSQHLNENNQNRTLPLKSHLNKSAQLPNATNATYTPPWKLQAKGERCAPFCKTSANVWSEKCAWPSSACQDCEECSKKILAQNVLKQTNTDIEAFDENVEEVASKMRDIDAFDETAEVAKHDAWKKRELLSFDETVEEKKDRAQWRQHNLESFNENDLEKIERAKWKSHHFENLAGAPLDEDGYKYVAAMKNNGDMGRFIRGVIRAHGAIITDQSMLHGVVPYHSGAKNVQNYAALLHDLNGAAWLSSFEMGSGATATLDEIGYQDVVSMRSTAEMELFVRRVLVAHVASVNNEDDLRGLVPYYSGETASQNFHRLVAELSHAKWVEHFH